MVKGFYGAIGQAAKEHVIYDGDNEQDALRELQRKQREKQKKGYIVVSGNDPVSQVSSPQKKTITSR